MEATDGGGYSLLNDGGLIGAIDAPWARDAAGKSLRSTFAIEGDTLVLRADASGAQFPVVADPRFTVGRGIYMQGHCVLGLPLVKAVMRSCGR